MGITTTGCAAGFAPISLVITVLDAEADLRPLLESIARQQLLPSELVIVDLGSSDGTVDILRSWRPPVGAVFRLVEAPGSSASQARNMAIETAKFDDIAVVHGTVRLHTEWLLRMWAALIAGSDVVSGVVRPVGTDPVERTIGLLETMQCDGDGFGPPLSSGMSLAFSRSLWDAAGGYPEWLNAAQDSVFAIALQHAGGRVTVAPDAIASWRPRLSPNEYLSAAFHQSKAEGQCAIIVGGRTGRSLVDVLGLLALLATRRYPVSGMLAVAVFSGRVGRLYRALRASGSPGIAAEPGLLFTAFGMMLAVDMSRICGYFCGMVASAFAPERVLLVRSPSARR